MLWIARVACFVATLIPVVVKAHSRFEYPEAQQPLTNIKDGPCGDKTNNFEGIPMEITAGPMTVEIKESIQHKGAPFVIMLSGDGTDDEACMLLDHIPHNADAAKPLYNDEDTWTSYFITVEIPNLACAKCKLHMYNPMTDKIGADGVPGGLGCQYPEGQAGPGGEAAPLCQSVYHSCTVPFKISPVGDTLQDRNGFQESDQCKESINPTDFDFARVGDDGKKIAGDTLIPHVYHRESSSWTNGKLSPAPAKYQQITPGAQANYALAFPNVGGDTEAMVVPAAATGFGVFVLILLILAFIGVPVLMHLKPEMCCKDSMKASSGSGTAGLWMKMQHPDNSLGKIFPFINRCMQFVLGIIIMILVVIHVDDSWEHPVSSPVYMQIVTVFVWLWSIVGVLAALVLWKEIEPLASIRNFFGGKTGTLVLLVADMVCSVLYIVAAGLSCFFSTWTAAFIFLMLICCMSSVMWDYSAFMVKSAGEERETHPSSMEKGQTKVEAKQQENPVNNDVPNTKLPKQSPDDDADVIRVAEFKYEKDRDDELSFAEGDRIKVLEERSDGWARGILIDDPEQTSGMFPLNYTKLE